MEEIATRALAGWDNFYVITGSSGAALIGLVFVVITLVAETPTRSSPGAINAFTTPIVVHLGAVLLVSTIMSAPWPSLWSVAVTLAACGLAGLLYGGVVVYRTRRQTLYKPVLDDWIWHVTLPCCAYVALAAAAVLLGSSTRAALFIVAGATLALLLIAIRNAWDIVIYIIVAGSRAHATRSQER